MSPPEGAENIPSSFSLARSNQIDNSAQSGATMRKRRPIQVVTVIAATNRLEDLDEAVLRRFDNKIYVGVPRGDNRAFMIGKNLHNISNNLSSEEILSIAAMTEGWSGSDINVRSEYSQKLAGS